MGEVIIFVSVPMSGKTDKEINDAIYNAKLRFLKETGYVVDREVSFVHNHLGYEQIQIPKGANPNLTYLGEAIKKIAMCDEVIFGEGWKDARGCKIEHDVCEMYNIPYYEY